MKKSKSKALLYIFSNLQEGEVVKKNDVLNRYEIKERTFYRYIKDIRNFVEKPRGRILGDYIIADRKRGGYILKSKESKNLNEKEVLAISKVLLESRGFIKSEMEIMLNKILDNCISEDRESIKRIIGNELVNYVSPQHGAELVDKLWKISSAIKEQKVLDIGYCKIGEDGKVSEEVLRRVVYPQGILFSEYYFYLIAFMEGKNYEFPTIYRVDRVKEIVITDRNYKVEYSSRFQEGEFRKLIQFMQTGELERVRFRFTGRSIEAILDRLPNAKIVKEKDGSYIVETKMFGKGIKMWLLSQGESVEILSPDNLREEMKRTIEKMGKLYR